MAPAASKLRIAAVVVGALLLCLAAFFVWAGVAGTSKFERLQAVGKARLAELKAADPARPTLRGTSEPGNAWDDYDAALEQIKVSAHAKLLAAAVRHDPKADPAAGKASVEALAGASALLHRGAGRASSRYPYEWDKGVALPLPSLLVTQQASSLLILQARSAAGAGKPADAAAYLLDALQFGRDLGADGVIISEMLGYAAILAALEEIRDLAWAGRLDAPALSTLDRGLAVLESTLPDHARSLVNDVLLLGGLNDPAILGSWGPGRWMNASGIETTNGFLDRAAKAESGSWAELKQVHAAIEAEAQASWNPITKMTAPSLLPASRRVRLRRAQLRLVRVAVRWAAKGEPLDLDDPFGGRLQRLEKDGTLKVWSAGPDGVDDRGEGDWKGEGKDVVLEARR